MLSKLGDIELVELYIQAMQMELEKDFITMLKNKT